MVVNPFRTSQRKMSETNAEYCSMGQEEAVGYVSTGHTRQPVPLGYDCDTCAERL